MAKRKRRSRRKHRSADWHRREYIRWLKAISKDERLPDYLRRNFIEILSHRNVLPELLLRLTAIVRSGMLADASRDELRALLIHFILGDNKSCQIWYSIGEMAQRFGGDDAAVRSIKRGRAGLRRRQVLRDVQDEYGQRVWSRYGTPAVEITLPPWLTNPRWQQNLTGKNQFVAEIDESSRPAPKLRRKRVTRDTGDTLATNVSREDAPPKTPPLRRHALLPHVKKQQVRAERADDQRRRRARNREIANLKRASLGELALGAEGEWAEAKRLRKQLNRERRAEEAEARRQRA